MKDSFRSVLAFACITLLLVCTAPPVIAQSFEGVVSVNATSERGTVPMTYMIKGDDARMEFEGRPGMKAVMLIIGKEKKSYMLMSQMNSYMELPSGEGEGTTKKPEITKTGKTQKLLGYACEQLVVKHGELESEIWVTKQLGKFVMFRTEGGPQQQSSGDTWQESLAGGNWFPLLATTKQGEKERGKYEVTKIEKKELDASLFKIPDGYSKFDRSLMQRPRQ
jgi:hypothetical protein